MNKPDYKHDEMCDVKAKKELIKKKADKAIENAGAMYWASALLDPYNKAPRVAMLRQTTMRLRASKLCYEVATRWGETADKLYDKLKEGEANE